MRRQHRIDEMMKVGCERAGHGHRPQMIEAMLVENGFPEAPEFIDQPHIWRELKEIAGRASRREETEREIRQGEPNSVPPGRA
jgi:hypothetical protein